MKPITHSRPPDGLRARGFTLVEIIVAITIVAVIAAVAIPTMKGMQRDEKFKEPMHTLAAVVQEARHRAMRERRSYQIVFEPGGIHASPVIYPYEKLEDFLAELERMRTPPLQQGIVVQGVEKQLADEEQKPRPPEPPWTVSIPVEKNTECGVLMWGDGEWDVLDGGKMRRWVFQPAGMSSPARIRLRGDGGEMEAGFDPLTGEVTGERTRIVSLQP
jgi:prepilin-type N-terminal cleavage/methylation domain-containing protein